MKITFPSLPRLIFIVYVLNVILIFKQLNHLGYFSKNDIMASAQSKQHAGSLRTSPSTQAGSRAVLEEKPKDFNEQHEVLRILNSTKHLRRPSYETVFNLTFATRHDMPVIKRRFSQANHTLAMQLLRDLVQVLEDHNVPYVMAYGTLLGSYLFHDVVPWDDDVDLNIPLTHINQLRAAFRSEQFRAKFGVTSFHDPWDTYSLVALAENVSLSNPERCVIPKEEVIPSTDGTCRYKGKVFYKDQGVLVKSKSFKSRFPFVDFVFYIEKGRFIEMFDFVNSGKTVYYRRDFLPFHLRPFNSLWLPAPKHPRMCLFAKYKKFVCKGNSWDHMIEDTAKRGLYKGDHKCKNVPETYPYVRRVPYNGTGVLGRNVVKEEFVYHNQVLYSVLVKEYYEGEWALSIS